MPEVIHRSRPPSVGGGWRRLAFVTVMQMADASPGTRVLAEPAAVAHAAGRMLDLSRACGDLTRPLLSTMDTQAPLGGGARLALAHQATVADVGRLLDALTQVLEGDADRLYQVAFALRAADDAAARRLGR